MRRSGLLVRDVVSSGARKAARDIGLRAGQLVSGIPSGGPVPHGMPQHRGTQTSGRGRQGPNWQWGRMRMTIPVLCGGVGLSTLTHALNQGKALDSAPVDKTPSGAEGGSPKAPELVYTADLYGGIIIDPSSLPDDPALFKEVVSASLAKWKSEGKKGVWVKIPASLSSHIPHAVNIGFSFHHASSEAVMMSYWLPDTPSTLPHNASHYVGVGVAVVDDQDRILVVQERSGPAAARGKDFWKVPTGLVNHNESIADAAEREVMEETGIRVQFEGVVAFREQNNSGVERKTDLFFMCKARPLSSDISMQESELANCKWMPAEEYANMPLWAEGSAYWTLNRLGIEQALKGRLNLSGPRLASVPTFAAKKLPRGHGTGHLHIYSGIPW